MELNISVLETIGYSRPYVKGKFIFVGDQKYLIKGVTYGTFKPDADNYQFPEYEVVESDFQMMQANGINSVRTYTVPPPYIFDLALQYDLKLMVGLPWEQHITFLDEPERKTSIIKKIREYVKICSSHPAILCYTIGNEIPAPVVRWYGKKKIEQFLRELYAAVKSADPQGLVTYVNYPTTEYLELPFLDFLSFNVYLETQDKLNAYLSRLHNLCGDLPLVLAEIGLDSLRNTEETQAHTLAWQSQIIFGKGCAGMFVFAWTDEWWRGGHEIPDWDFGITDRQRNPKPALAAVKEIFNNVPFHAGTNAPAISVVVCSYNGSSTIDDCMRGLMKVNYSNFEVIVVNDGSTDNLADIVRKYPFRLISTVNRGLSNARNTGMMQATGDIVVYLDDDAYPDPDWLNYLAYAFLHSHHAAIGGPNLLPAEDGAIATCVASSPGGPAHVLLTDEIAEHIPGCNFAVRKNALQKIGGFDPVFRSAGDDVDVCWKLQAEGYTIGFHHAALVWHHRRNSIAAYWKQQKGYGKAEALLEAKWPEKYNALGHYAWGGSIYGNGITMPVAFKKKKIFYGTWGTALFQSVYQPGNGLLSSLPLMPEWFILSIGFLCLSLLGFIWPVLLFAWAGFFLATIIVVYQSFYSAFINISKARIAHDKFRHVLFTGFFHLLQPVARLTGRLKHGLTPWRRRDATPGRKFHFKFSGKPITVWSEQWRAPADWITDLEKNLVSLKAGVKRGREYDNWDLQSRNHLLVCMRSTLLAEEHGEGKQFLKLKYRLRVSPVIVALFISAISLAAVCFAWHEILPGLLLLLLALATVISTWRGATISWNTLHTSFTMLEYYAISASEAPPGQAKKKNSQAVDSGILIYNN